MESLNNFFAINQTASSGISPALNFSVVIIQCYILFDLIQRNRITFYN